QPNLATFYEVAGFNNASLLGAAAGLPKDRQKITKGTILDQRQERVELLLRDVVLARRGCWQFHVGNGRSRDDALLSRPVKSTLPGANCRILCVVRLPAKLPVNPAGDVKGLQIRRPQSQANEADERFKIPLVPFVGRWFPVAGCPCQVFIDHASGGD